MDPDANLGLALGLTEEEVNAIVPVSKMKELAKERTAANESNTFYKLNPEVSDLPDAPEQGRQRRQASGHGARWIPAAAAVSARSM